MTHAREIAKKKRGEWNLGMLLFRLSSLEEAVRRGRTTILLLVPPTLSCHLSAAVLLLHSCPTAPAPRRCPTASVSPPSSARTLRPPSTTPPGCSSSRSGSGPASPPSSRRRKSSPPSVSLNLLHLKADDANRQCGLFVLE